MKFSSLIFIFLFISNISIAQQLQWQTHEWYKLRKPEFFQEQTGFNKYLFERIRLPRRFEEVKDEFIAEFELDSNNIVLIKQLAKISPPKLNEDIMDWILFNKKDWTQANLNGKPIKSKITIRVKYGTAMSGSSDYYCLMAKYIFEPSPQLANDYFNEGVKFAELGNFVEAIKYYNETLYLYPKDIDALFNRGICKYKTSDFEGACEDWKKINSMGKQDADKLIAKYCN